MTIGHLIDGKMVQLRARSADAKAGASSEYSDGSKNIQLRRDGFDAFTMNKLAAATNLAKGTLYLYFATREELVNKLWLLSLNDGCMSRIITARKTDS